ncbi:MAG: ribbon-helix-helix protein, CopG family [Deltaproteobacteria bacterium]|nr:ribbon-helix-helix protein, CopG family [Deltaproteobacteria bacterium]
MGAAKIMTISLPPQMSKEIQKLAQEEQRTISELIREAFRQYKMNRVLEAGRREGKRSRHGKKLTDDEIERLIDELRK